jgi:hypothetical protein
MRIPLRRDRTHIVRVNMMTDAHGLCPPAPHSDRYQHKLPAVTSGLYGPYSFDYIVKWKLRRILPMGWHAHAGADNMLLRTSAAASYFRCGALNPGTSRRNKRSMTLRRTPADGDLSGDPARA